MSSLPKVYSVLAEAGASSGAFAHPRPRASGRRDAAMPRPRPCRQLYRYKLLMVVVDALPLGTLDSQPSALVARGFFGTDPEVQLCCRLQHRGSGQQAGGEACIRGV